MTLALSNPNPGLATAEVLRMLVAENPSVCSLFIFAYRHPPLLQSRLALTLDEEAIVQKAIFLREETALPFWEALMLSCFNEDRDYSRLLMEATFHHSHRDALQRIARSDVLEGRLTDVVNSEVGEHLSFSSLIEIMDMGIRHIPLLDFHCPESCTNDRVVSEISRQLFRSPTLLLSSGESYHAFGLQTLDETSLRDFLARSLLFAPIVDARYVAHQLLEGACALRLTCSLTKPSRPRLKFVVDVEREMTLKESAT